MNKALPRIEESAETLKKLMQHETDGLKKQRLQALYLLASGQAGTRVRVAELIGVNRNTVGQWLSSYQQGGLVALLTVATPPGREPTLSSSQQQRLQEALAQPEGFASYGAIVRWIEQELGVAMPYKTVHHLVRYRLKAKLKRPRPSHVEKK